MRLLFNVRPLVALAIYCFLWQGIARAQYSPEHPTVQKMVERGIDFLEKSNLQRLGGEYQTGGELLVGLTILKVTGDPDHSIVKVTIGKAISLANSLRSSRNGGDSKIVYDTCVACLLLADADAGIYRPQLESIRDWLVAIQKPHGGYGYFGQPTGDTSQTQYVMLALWTLNAVEVPVPATCIEAVVQYLLATQDPSGGWGYQGVLGTSTLVKQESVTTSLTTAGLGATLIGGDILGFYRGRRLLREQGDDDVPKAFVRVDLKEKDRATRKDITMSSGDISGPVSLSTRWLNQNPYGAPTFQGWYFYYRYSQERCESFLEIMEGKQQKSPAWYNAGVEELRRLQSASGGWLKGSIDHCPDDICTAFAILYLIRSTQKAIGKLNEGILAGGYGLPKDVSTIQRIGDRIVSKEELSVEGLLKTLEANDTSNMELGMLPEHLQLAKDPQTRASQLARLSRLIYGKDWKARRIAAKLLGRSEDIRHVPDLIFALTDEDPEVPAIAEEGLRLLSRKLTVRHVDINATKEKKKFAYDYWKNWYLGVQPEYVFVGQ